MTYPTRVSLRDVSTLDDVTAERSASTMPHRPDGLVRSGQRDAVCHMKDADSSTCSAPAA